MRDGGKSVYEIADFYHLSYSYAYKLVRKLAERMGVPYESLLVRPHSAHIVTREIALFDETIEASLDDAGHTALFSQLRDQEEAEDFRPRDLRVVARIIRIVANLDAPVEIIFEDEEVKRAYDVFAGSAK